MPEGQTIREHLVKSTAQISSGTNVCTSVTIHETANSSVGADDHAHANLQSDGKVRQAAWRITLVDSETIRSYPDTAQCWHVGTREGAGSSISVEFCVNAGGAYDKALPSLPRPLPTSAPNTASLAARYMKTRTGPEEATLPSCEPPTVAKNSPTLPRETP